MIPPARFNQLAVFAILAAALCLRLTAGCWWQQRLEQGSKFAYGDSYSYWILAESIAEGEAYEYGPGRARAFRMPGYPWVLAGLFVLWGEEPPVLWVRGWGAILGTLTVGGVIWLALQRFDPPTALLAGALAAVYPGAIGMSVLVLSEAAYCPLMLTQLICWTEAMKKGPLRRAMGWGVAGGIAAGLATLVRPSWLLFTPVAALVAVACCSARWRQLVIAASMLSALIVVMSPWWIRNYRVYERFVPTTLQVGASLYDGLNPQATGGSDMAFVARFYAEQQRVDAAGQSPPPGTLEERLDRRMREAALNWAGEHPGRALQLMAIKLLRMWNPWPNAAEMGGGAMGFLILLGYLPLVGLAICGLAEYTGRGWSSFLCVLPAIYFTSLHMVFVSSIRYRQPAMLPLIVLAAGVLAQFGRVHWARRRLLRSR